ncbi:MAG: hypothetical protein WD749_00525 [Phycisphaerales bacterium]
MLSGTMAAAFRTTRWTLIHLLRDADATRRREAQDALYRTYRGPVLAYLRKKGVGAEAAEELAQSFYVKVVLGRQLFERADRSRGRLRALLCESLANYRKDDARRGRARRRLQAAVSPGGMAREQLEMIERSRNPDEAFDRSWAMGIVQRCVDKAQSHYLRIGREHTWRAFEERRFLPAANNCRPPAPAALAIELGFDSAADLNAAVQTVQKRLNLLIREETGDDYDHFRTLMG